MSDKKAPRVEKIHQAMRDEKRTETTRALLAEKEKRLEKVYRNGFSGQIGGQFDHHGTLHVIDLHSSENRHYTPEMLRVIFEPDYYDHAVFYTLSRDKIGGPGPEENYRKYRQTHSARMTENLRDKLAHFGKKLQQQDTEIEQLKAGRDQFQKSIWGRIYTWLNKTK